MASVTVEPVNALPADVVPFAVTRTPATARTGVLGCSPSRPRTALPRTERVPGVSTKPTSALLCTATPAMVPLSSIVSASTSTQPDFGGRSVLRSVTLCVAGSHVAAWAGSSGLPVEIVPATTCLALTALCPKRPTTWVSCPFGVRMYGVLTAPASL